MKLNKLFIYIPLLLSGCASGPSYNTVMQQWVASQQKVAEAQANAQVEIAKAEAQKAVALSNAPLGGMSITLDDGQVLTYTNPNAYLYAQNGGQSVTKTAPNSLQISPVQLPAKPASWFDKAAGYTAGILDKTINVALNNAAGVFSIVETNKTQRAVAKYNYLSDKSMYDTFGGFGTNMENTATNAINGNVAVATTATNDMQLLGSNAVGQMYLLGRAGYESIANNNANAFGAIRDISTAAFENPLTNSTFIQTTSEQSSFSSSTFTEQFPDWSTWPVVTPTP